MNICTPSSVNNSNNKHRQANHTANRVSKPGRKTMNELQTRYRDKLLALWNSAFCFMDGTRRVIDAFMVLPSRHDYPQYYDVIEKPVDMNIIKGKIDADEVYISSDELITDIKLLFNNARTFNEPGSQIYRDSSKLESVVMSTLASFNDAPLFSPNYMKQKYGWVNTKLPSKHRARRSNAERLEQDSDNLSHDAELHSIRDASASVSVSTSNARAMQCGEYQQMIDLYSLIKNLKDHRGRLLSSAFLELPSKLVRFYCLFY
ncbi:unnamed protein product [Anisakis simplex]|uniref:Protein polybromo-1 (inferred by orthology to a human protein) n=1 Tax=Anisakis simplex TaxID=6269 RepID=A0A0M3KJ56_ANISI|nr:unnamed protein product [Anisakis simplex]